MGGVVNPLLEGVPTGPAALAGNDDGLEDNTDDASARGFASFASVMPSLGGVWGAEVVFFPIAAVTTTGLAALAIGAVAFVGFGGPADLDVAGLAGMGTAGGVGATGFGADGGPGRVVTVAG